MTPDLEITAMHCSRLLERRPTNRSRRNPQRPTLRFTPTAWLRALRLRNRNDIVGFGIADPADPLRLVDVTFARRVANGGSVRSDDEADRRLEFLPPPERGARVLIRGAVRDSPLPSATDDAIFRRIFGQADWTAMCVVARRGRTHARLRFHVGPGAELRIPVEIEGDGPTPAAVAWRAASAEGKPRDPSPGARILRIAEFDFLEVSEGCDREREGLSA